MNDDENEYFNTFHSLCVQKESTDMYTPGQNLWPFSSHIEINIGLLDFDDI